MSSKLRSCIGSLLSQGLQRCRPAGPCLPCCSWQLHMGHLMKTPCSNMASMRHFATRQELLERLRQAKAQDMQYSQPAKNMWEDRRTYLLLAGLLASAGWAYSLLSEHSITNQVYMDISIGGQHAGRLVLGLHGNSVPRATLNFLELATHRCGYGYRGCNFHEIMPRFAVIGGDITKGDGTGGVSALGPSFPKEKSPIKHGRGTLSMVPDEDRAVRSQFFICCSAAPHLNSQMVAFGKVLEGMQVVDKVCELPTDQHHRPLLPVVITDSGELAPQPSDGTGSMLQPLWGWLKGSSSSGSGSTTSSSSSSVSGSTTSSSSSSSSSSVSTR